MDLVVTVASLQCAIRRLHKLDRRISRPPQVAIVTKNFHSCFSSIVKPKAELLELVDL
jgi:hypothetical protein